ncbi:MAG: UbiD family decarboxylase, partial [Dehalococcoidia bacterium]|nr:UbiD family decarboxylase [Dehalococcoidia bacterium]
MALDDLRQLMEILESEGELLRIPEEVDAKYEIGAWCRVVSDAGGPALLFERVKGHEIPILVNAFGTRKRIALALGLKPEEMLEGCLSRLEKRIPARMVPTGDAPCQQVVLTGDDADMTKLPIPLWSIGDGGPYITASVHFSKHPQFGKNASINRMLLKGPREMAVCMAPDHYLRMVLDDAKRQGAEGIEVAVAIGMDPTIYIAASSDFAIGDYEIEVAGALRGEPVAMVKCKTIDAEVPANAEIVLEGIFTGKTDDEGPFVEYTGHQTPIIQSPVFEVKAITHRRDPIFQAVYLSKSPCEANNL